PCGCKQGRAKLLNERRPFFACYGSTAASLARMVRMVALMDEVFLWDGSDGLGLRNRSFLLQCQLGPFRGSNSEKLPCDLARKNLGKQRRYGIADLSLHGHASANEFEVSR